MNIQDRDAFLAKIVAEPSNTLAKLVYADWLDENAGSVKCPVCHGTPNPPFGSGGKSWSGCGRCSGTGFISDDNAARAEFIRLQVELSSPTLGPDGTGDSQSRSQIEQRAWSLWQSHWPKWVADERAYPVSLEYAVRIRQDEQYDNDVQLTFRDGFVSDVYCPLAWWAGGECGRCRMGVGNAPAQAPYSICPACRGTGRIPAHGRDVIAAHPITRVVITDRSPHLVEYPTPSANFWRWWSFVVPQDAPTRYQSAMLPPDVYELLREKHPFATSQSAADALSESLIAHAKSPIPK